MKKLLVAGVIFLGLALGYGAVAIAYPPFPPGVYNRMERYGFFLNRYDPSGDRVWKGVAAWGDEALPPTIDTADEFIGYVKAKLTGPFQSSQDRVGASFIIQTMIGNQGNVGNHPPSAAEIAEWEARVRYAESRNLITWRFDYTYVLNSYYQGCCGGSNWDDDGFYDGPGTAPSIVFGDGSGGGFGNVIYAIKWKCANPVGTLSALPDDMNFNMSGTSSVDDPTVVPGQQIIFTHSLTNNGPTATNPSTIGWTTHGGPSSSGPWSNQNTGNPGTFANGQSRDVSTQTVIVPNNAPPNSQICRYISWAPDTQAGATGTSTPVCATVQFDFTLIPTVRVEVNDGATPGDFAEPGDKVEFIYSVGNSGTTATSNIACTIYGLSRNGFYNIPNPADSTSDAGFVQPPHGCPRTFPAGPSSTDIVTETINSVSAADINKSLCRSLYITPASATGGTASHESCARIVAKPYFRVYGGDVSAGGGQTQAGGCLNNLDASIIGWNRGSGTGYAGAAIQHAGLALGRIYEVATSQGNAGGAAPPPSGLAFTNTAPVGSMYGGTLGSLPCITDYYDPTGAQALPSTNLSSLSGIARYAATGPIAINGNINPNQRTVLYVEGDVLISDNILYPGTWNMNSLPLFQLVVLGNIYISQTVTRIDGLFIAQADGGSGGVIYTCANPGLPATPVLTTGGLVYTSCRNGLEINGALMAKQVQFLRTRGTLRSATAGELNTSTNIAEVINFSPSLWLAQPPTISGSNSDYDAITSLPPIL